MSCLIMLRPCIRRLASLSGITCRTFLSTAESSQQPAQPSKTRQAALLGTGRGVMHCMHSELRNLYNCKHAIPVAATPFTAYTMTYY